MAADLARSDLALIDAMRVGDREAESALKARHGSTFRRICLSLAPNEQAGAKACEELLASARFAALFESFDGKSSFETYAAVAIASDFLFPRLKGDLVGDPVAAAGAFEAFFRPAISGAIHRLGLNDPELERDAFQWIFEQLLRDEGRQLRAFGEQAKSQGFVVVKLRYLARDFLDSRDAPAERRRRDVPESLKQAPAFDQAVFQQVYWWRAPSANVALLALRSRFPEVSEQAILDARARVDQRLAAARGSFQVDRQAIPLDGAALEVAAEPEADEDEPQRAAFRSALLDAARELSSGERLYLLLLLQGHPARAMATRLRLPVEEIYGLGRKVLAKLRRRLRGDPAARALMMSLGGSDGIAAPVGGGSPNQAEPGKGSRS